MSFKTIIRAACFALLLVPSLSAQSRQLPISAVTYMEYLNKTEFDKRFPGKAVYGNQLTEDGYYLVYEHESLRYYFGPEASKGVVELYEPDLRRVYQMALAKRESLKTAKIYILEWPQNKTATPASPSTSPSSLPSIPSPPQPKSWWQKLLEGIGF